MTSRRKANELKVILSALFSTGYNFTLSEKVSHGLKQRFEEEELLSQPHPGKYHYGYTHEFLFARAVREVRCERNEQNHCECTLFWKELPKLTAMPHLTSIPRDSFKYERGAACIYRLWEDETPYSYTYCAKFD